MSMLRLPGGGYSMSINRHAESDEGGFKMNELATIPRESEVKRKHGDSPPELPGEIISFISDTPMPVQSVEVRRKRDCAALGEFVFERLIVQRKPCHILGIVMVDYGDQGTGYLRTRFDVEVGDDMKDLLH